MTTLAERGARCSAGESGFLSSLRAKMHSSNTCKLGDAVTVDVWRVEVHVGSEHGAQLQAPESFAFMLLAHASQEPARRPNRPRLQIKAHDADDGIMGRSHDCVKPDVIRAETGLGESELGHELPLPHNSLSGPQQRSGEAPTPLIS
jgi:hypothetical protein